jgi:hypothetical protein
MSTVGAGKMREIAERSVLDAVAPCEHDPRRCIHPAFSSSWRRPTGRVKRFGARGTG